jgi:Arc/MetJ-type ribon-helix-helix transcriptional regulator
MNGNTSTPEGNIKVTYSLPAAVVSEVREVVQSGAAESASAFVASALTEALRVARERRLAEEFREAASDPAFLSDLAEVEKDFQAADAEAGRDLP